MSSADQAHSDYRRSVFRYAMSVALPVGTYGIAFGASGIANGFTVLQTCLLSLLLFSGASQFAFVGVIGAGGTPLSAIATSGLLGIRNGLYALRMSQLLRAVGLKKYFAAQLTIDESTGVALAQEARGEPAMRYGFWATGIGVYVFWNLFTALGAYGAQALGDPSAWGLDAAVPAAFLGLVWPRLTDKRTQSIAIIAMALATLLVPFVPAGVPIIATVGVALIFGWRSR